MNEEIEKLFESFEGLYPAGQRIIMCRHLLKIRFVDNQKVSTPEEPMNSDDIDREAFQAFKQAWQDYPSQDNEGFHPDRGGFKCEWFAALRWIKENR